MTLFKVVINNSDRNSSLFQSYQEAKSFFDLKKNEIVLRTRGCFTAVKNSENEFSFIWDGWNERNYTMKIVPTNLEKL
jgi:hypothetical protein